MNTPGHAIVNLLLLGRRGEAGLFLPIGTGAVAPDAPMVFFYAYEKLWLGIAENVIWSSAYFAAGWQSVFDLFHSFPVLGALALASHIARRAAAAGFFVSMTLHSLFDFLLHHDDAHRHFFPLSGWRFASPVSYWDPRHYGDIVSIVEILVVVTGALFLAARHRGWGARLFLSIAVSGYVAYIVYAILVWS